MTPDKINIDELSKNLEQAVGEFELDFGGKKVWTPYRINLPFQSDRRRYGKSTAVELRQNTEQIAQEVGFDIDSASALEIADFMRDQKLGIDCSGLVYQLFDKAFKEMGYGGMEEIGFPKASLSNVALLTSPEYAIRVDETASNLQPGDMFMFGGKKDEWHVMMIISVDSRMIEYVDSSRYNDPDGVAKHKIRIVDQNKSVKDQEWNHVLNTGETRQSRYKTASEDGIYRLIRLK